MKRNVEVHYIRETLTSYLHQIGVSFRKLESQCGFSNGYFRTVGFNVPIDRINRILTVLPDLNRNWLLTGSGEMTNGLQNLSYLSYGFMEQRSSILNRITTLLSLENTSLAAFEENHSLAAGTVERNMFGSLSALYILIDRIMLDFPGYSWDWVLNGRLPARIAETMRIPIVSSPGDYCWKKGDINKGDFWPRKYQDISANNDNYKNGLIEIASLDYISTTRNPELRYADFAFVSTNDTMSPKINRGDTIICKVTAAFDERNAAYLISYEDQDGGTNNVLGYAEASEGGVIKVANNLNAAPIYINKVNIVTIGKVIGTLRTF